MSKRLPPPSGPDDDALAELLADDQAEHPETPAPDPVTSPLAPESIQQLTPKPQRRKFAWAFDEHSAPMLSRSASVATDSDWEKTADHHGHRMLTEALRAAMRNPEAWEKLIQSPAFVELSATLAAFIQQPPGAEGNCGIR